ncbi:PPE family protein, SVP subgroup [Mycobacterium shimoidei]|uniref:PE-PGRS family protein, triacylglycerol lipase LipY (Esterase/lipase) (Triglyceride lipase) (Tributyrase) [Mycobacterium tuberculosis H37Rv] n=1 Tax=Mycobacterium shimoidei TaxID=29313 RepID=A0A1E3SUR5_MYCSH|nr:PE domain-containing protein [Mycobacterium shimoidei]MCV7259207.1 PE domain-containing protein [Mycobacterium shimoidei]ODR05829.1 hypothetical protein BHQ16_22015 [Mycobacterium shimoidei]ORW79605.1 hypothetical protein AWC26_14395 [Mycobacterium shimoidei]SRX93934.1 PE-PGRS family protein, triacylglycerol lipase LipY (esterase/lipase) (triglyceride lipase) (tributyrase) [Mycobacterium tuberculosis H37Rv] [Mycobacterium shimoidei]
MSFVTTHPEALTAAAANLQAVGSAVAAQNAAAAAPTTGVIPAAADEVSALQATQFAAYGNLYQQISAQATAIHEMFVHTLGRSAGLYGDTEAANSVAAAAASDAPVLNGLTTQIGNFGSAASDLLQLGSSGFLAPGALANGQVPGLGPMAAGLSQAGAVSSVGPATPAATTGAPVLAGVGRASSVGRLSVPPSWVAEGGPVVSSGPPTLTGAGWTTAPQSTSVAAMPAGMPAAASGGRSGFGFGVPRYGVKPTVMPKSAVV